MNRSPSLLGYSKLIHYARSYAGESKGDLKYAIDEAVKQCINEGFISEFLEKHSREVSGMLFKEITAEEFAEIRAEEAKKLMQHEIAKKLKYLGTSIDVISQSTGLTSEEIEAL